MNTDEGPRWMRIAQTLEREIAQGRLHPGARIASEHALAERFAVNRHTVRQAVGHLAAKGTLCVIRGKGTFVGEWAIGYALGPHTRFSENLAREGLAGRHIPIDAATLPATDDVAARLTVRRGTRVIRLRTRGEAQTGPDDPPRTLSVSEHFFPARRFAGIDRALAATGSISRALAALGIARFTRSASWITAGLPDPETAALLRQTTQRPVLRVESVNVDADGVPIEFGRTQFAGDRMQLVVEHGR